MKKRQQRDQKIPKRDTASNQKSPLMAKKTYKISTEILKTTTTTKIQDTTIERCKMTTQRHKDHKEMHNNRPKIQNYHKRR